VCGLKFVHIDFAHLSPRLVRTLIHDQCVFLEGSFITRLIQERVKVCVKFLPTDIRGTVSSNVRILKSPPSDWNHFDTRQPPLPPPSSPYLLLLLRDGDIAKRINFDFYFHILFGLRTLSGNFKFWYIKADPHPGSTGATNPPPPLRPFNILLFISSSLSVRFHQFF